VFGEGRDVGQEREELSSLWVMGKVRLFNFLENFGKGRVGLVGWEVFGHIFYITSYVLFSLL